VRAPDLWSRPRSPHTALRIFGNGRKPGREGTEIPDLRNINSDHWPPAIPTVIQRHMGEHTEQRITERARIPRNRPAKQAPETVGRRQLQIVVYDKSCRIGGSLTLDDLIETEIGDWKMPAFKAPCSYAASQGWLIVQDDALTLTTAGLAAASASETGLQTVRRMDRTGHS
jgi:hypothetical protein